MKFVAAKNVHRRNLTTNERALIAAKMASLVHGSNRFERKVEGVEDVSTSSMVSLKQAAELMGVCRDTVVSAKTILDHGSKIDIAAVSKGAGLRPMADKIRSSFTQEQQDANDRGMVRGSRPRTRGDAAQPSFFGFNSTTLASPSTWPATSVACSRASATFRASCSRLKGLPTRCTPSSRRP